MSIHPTSNDTSNTGPNAQTTSDQDDTLPAPDHVSDQQTVVPDLTGGPTQRPKAFRIQLPRDPKQFDELPNEINGLILWILTDVYGENCIESVEVLFYVGPTGLDIILHPRPTYLSGNSGTQSKLTNFSEKLYRPAVSKMKAAIKRRAPPTVTAEVGYLDMSTLGMTDVTTTRLYGSENAQQLPPGNSSDEPLEELFKKLRENDDPFIYQVIVEEDGGKLNTVVRLALYHPRDNYSGDRGFARLATQGKPNDLARVFRKHNVVSNHEDLAHRYHDIRYKQLADGTESYHVGYSYERATYYTVKSDIRRKADKIKEVVLGKEEHRRMKNGDTTGDLICEDDFPRKKRLNLFPAELYSFVRLVDQQWETNPWLAISGRSAPQFHATDEIEIETPAHTGSNTKTDSSLPEGVDFANEGTTGHITTGESARKILTEGGDEIREVDQDSRTLPDNRADTPEGKVHTLELPVSSEITPIEIETKNVTKGSNTLKNAERAYAADRDVIFVYKKGDVETGYEHLATTYKRDVTDKDDNKVGVILYNKTDLVKTLDGWTLVRRGLESTTYILRGSTLTALDDGEVFGHGDANDHLNTFEWECHRHKEVDGKYRVETLDGELVEEYASKEAFKADWTKVHEPHIPVGICYLDFATVTYHDEQTNELRVWEPTPEWVTSDKSETWKGGVEAFEDNYIVEREGDRELTYDEFEAVFAAWFEGHCGYDAPPRSVIGGPLSDELSEANTGASGNAYRYFKGYSWKIDPNIDSPHQQGPPADYEPEAKTENENENEADSTTNEDTNEDIDEDIDETESEDDTNNSS